MHTNCIDTFIEKKSNHSNLTLIINILIDYCKFFAKKACYPKNLLFSSVLRGKATYMIIVNNEIWHIDYAEVQYMDFSYKVYLQKHFAPLIKLFNLMLSMFTKTLANSFNRFLFSQIRF